MPQEQVSADSIEQIKRSQVAQIELPETLVGAFHVARTVARGDFFLMGSAVRKCVLDEPRLSGDIDFMGDFDLDHVQQQFGQQFIRKWEQFKTVKVGWHGNEIDFIASTRILDTLEGGDITLSLMCMDQNGYVYDPLNYIDDFRRRLIRIDNPVQKVKISPDRILRVLRFAAELGYEVDEATRKACISNAYLMDVGNTEYALNKFLHMQPAAMDRAMEIAKDYEISDKVKGLIADKYEVEIRGDTQFNLLSSALERLLETPEFFVFGGTPRDLVLGRPPKDIDVKLDKRVLDTNKAVGLLESKGMVETRDFTLPEGTFYINRTFSAVSFRINGVLVDLTFTEDFDPVQWYKTADINLNGLVFDNRTKQLYNRNVIFDIAARRLELCDPNDKNLDPLKVVNALKQMTRIEGLRVSDESLSAIRSNILTLCGYFQENPDMLYKLHSLRGNPYTSEVTSFLLGCNGGSNLIDLLSGIN